MKDLMMASRSKRVVQGDIFDVGISQAKKAAALDNHESGHGKVLAALRVALRDVFYMREAKHGAGAFVTADDARFHLRHHPELRATPGPWMGALFKAPGWRFTGRRVASVIASNNARDNRCWRYDP